MDGTVGATYSTQLLTNYFDRASTHVTSTFMTYSLNCRMFMFMMLIFPGVSEHVRSNGGGNHTVRGWDENSRTCLPISLCIVNFDCYTYPSGTSRPNPLCAYTYTIQLPSRSLRIWSAYANILN